MRARNSPSSLVPSSAPAACSGDSSQILDCKIMLDSVENDLDLLQQLAELFFAETPGLLAQIRSGLAEHNAEQVERCAHTLKGALSNFGARRACRAALELEIRGRDARLENADGSFSTLEAEIAVVSNVLSDYLREVKREHPAR
jgi:HPt (histidine-containing phosphotransfer) domain-containing protein